ncbi:MAG: hypothetical protein O7E52_15070 [Candidatus Poribacteria bacterium]|nr:hypothetical protein [Candidatus Poribacteria bacterium]
MADVIRGAVIGYGAAFNMGRAHANMMQRTDGIECVAICDIDTDCLKTAKADFPDVSTYIPCFHGEATLPSQSG